MSEEQAAQINNEAESESSEEQTTLLGEESKADNSSNDEASAGSKEGGEGSEEESSKETGAPEEYADFEMPDGIQLNEELGSEFKTAAKEMNLTQEQAQKFITIQSEYVAAQQKATQDAFIEQTNAWADEVKADTEFGGSKLDSTLATASRALDKYGTPELKELLNSSGLGNHPEMVRFVARVGRSVSEDTLEVGGQPSSKQSRADIMYGSNS